MFEKEFQEWFECNKKWLYSSDHMQAAYHAWCAGVQQQQAVEHTLAPDVCHSTADGRHLFQNDSNGRYCIACGMIVA